MNHPDGAELIELQRGELQEDRASAVEEHLRNCEKCHEEWKALGVVEQHLEEWHDATIPPSFVEETMEMVEMERPAPAVEVKEGRRKAAGFRWMRRFALATGAVAASLIFQAMVWNPLDTPSTFRAVFDLTPAAIALPQPGQAIPDTILVLTLYDDESFESTLLQGRYEAEELIDELLKTIEKGRFKKILLLGKDPSNPVTFRLDRLQRLLDELEISNVTVGEGAVGLQIAEDRSARIRLPLNIRAVVSDSLRSYFITRHDSTRAFVEIKPIVVEVTAEEPRIRSYIRVERPEVQISVREDSTRTIVISEAMSDSFRTIITGRIRPVEVETFSGVITFDSLTDVGSTVLTVTEGGIVLMNRAVIPIEEIEESLKNLKDYNNEVSLVILVPEGSGPDDLGYRIVELANQLGIIKVIIKKIKP